QPKFTSSFGGRVRVSPDTLHFPSRLSLIGQRTARQLPSLIRVFPRGDAASLDALLQREPATGHASPGSNCMATRSLNVNGRAGWIPIDDPDMPLLYALRDNLGLKGPRFGCGLAQCGACTVHVDGSAVRSCVTPLSSIEAGQRVVTLEGLGTPQ